MRKIRGVGCDFGSDADLNGKIVLYHSNPLLDVTHLLDFGKLYRVVFKTGKSKIYPRELIGIEDDLQKKHRELWEHWCDIAQHVKIGEADGEKGATFVARAFASISCIHPESALAQYMNGTQRQIELDETPLIFPFDFNHSQQEAVIQAHFQSRGIEKLKCRYGFRHE